MDDNIFFVLIFGLCLAFIWFVWVSRQASVGEEVDQEFSIIEQQERLATGINQTFGD